MTFSAPSTNSVDLSEMTKAELLAFAEENGIDGVSSSMLKAEIYEVVESWVNENAV